jgi:hypothetical protein
VIVQAVQKSRTKIPFETTTYEIFFKQVPYLVTKADLVAGVIHTTIFPFEFRIERKGNGRDGDPDLTTKTFLKRSGAFYKTHFQLGKSKGGPRWMIEWAKDETGMKTRKAFASGETGIIISWTVRKGNCHLRRGEEERRPVKHLIL